MRELPDRASSAESRASPRSASTATAASPDGGACVPKTCADYLLENKDCGPQSNGCGGTVDCGECVDPEFCGGGGPSKCAVSGGGVCVPKTCADYPGKCGPQPNGCGGVTSDCGACTATPRSAAAAALRASAAAAFLPADGGGACVPRVASCGADGVREGRRRLRRRPRLRNGQLRGRHDLRRRGRAEPVRSAHLREDSRHALRARTAEASRTAAAAPSAAEARARRRPSAAAAARRTSAVAERSPAPAAARASRSPMAMAARRIRADRSPTAAAASSRARQLHLAGRLRRRRHRRAVRWRQPVHAEDAGRGVRNDELRLRGRRLRRFLHVRRSTPALARRARAAASTHRTSAAASPDRASLTGAATSVQGQLGLLLRLLRSDRYVSRERVQERSTVACANGNECCSGKCTGGVCASTQRGRLQGVRQHLRGRLGMLLEGLRQQRLQHGDVSYCRQNERRVHGEHPVLRRQLRRRHRDAGGHLRDRRRPGRRNSCTIAGTVVACSSATDYACNAACCSRLLRSERLERRLHRSASRAPRARSEASSVTMDTDCCVATPRPAACICSKPAGATRPTIGRCNSENSCSKPGQVCKTDGGRVQLPEQLLRAADIALAGGGNCNSNPDACCRHDNNGIPRCTKFAVCRTAGQTCETPGGLLRRSVAATPAVHARRGRRRPLRGRVRRGQRGLHDRQGLLRRRMLEGHRGRDDRHSARSRRARRRRARTTRASAAR